MSVLYWIKFIEWTFECSVKIKIKFETHQFVNMPGINYKYKKINYEQ